MTATLFETVVDQVVAQLDSGALTAGDRLPSVRAMSRAHKVSVNTVLHAYRRLEDEGRIEARARSGYFVRQTVRAMPVPRTARVALRAQRVRTQDLIRAVLAANADPELVPFGAASPAAAWLPLSRLHRVAARAVRRHSETAGMAIEPQGLAPLRQAIARQMIDTGCSVSPDAIIVTNGCMEAISLALRAVAHAGDSVAIESPVYYGIPLMLRRLGMNALELPVSATNGLDSGALERMLEHDKPAAAIIGANFQNPTGATISDADKLRLIALLARHRIPLIEDDLYGDLAHPEQPRPKALKAFDSAGNVMYCSSFSKTLAPGYRIGWIVPGGWFDTVWQLKLTTSLGSAAPVQLGIAEFLEAGAYRHHLRQLRHNLQVSVQRALAAIARHWPPVRVTHPRGGYLLWAELPSGVDAVKLYQVALQQRIGITPGPIFSATGRHRHHIRINCGHPWNPGLERGLRLLGDLVGAQSG